MVSSAYGTPALSLTLAATSLRHASAPSRTAFSAERRATRSAGTTVWKSTASLAFSCAAVWAWMKASAWWRAIACSLPVMARDPSTGAVQMDARKRSVSSLSVLNRLRRSGLDASSGTSAELTMAYVDVAHLAAGESAPADWPSQTTCEASGTSTAWRASRSATLARWLVLVADGLRTIVSSSVSVLTSTPASESLDADR